MPNYECPECELPCDTYEEDQRFAAHAPQGVQSYGSVYLLSKCCGEPVATDDCDDDFDFDFDFDDDDLDYDNPEDDFIN